MALLNAVLLDEGGGGYPWWLNLLTPQLVIALLTVLGVLLLIAAIAALVLYLRLRRSPRWRRARLVLESRYLPPGPSREAARLRLRVQSAISSAQRAVELAVADDQNPIGDLSGLLKRSQTLAVPLDRQLQLLQSEPEGAAERQAIQRARHRVEQLETAASQIRRAAAVDLEGVMVGELDQLKTDAERELTALQAGIDDLERLTVSAPTGRTVGLSSALDRSKGDPK